MINSIDEILLNVKNVGITGHVRPDGDCVGSTLGLYNYICDNYKNIEATVYLEEFEKCFSFINGSDKVLHDCDIIKILSDYRNDKREASLHCQKKMW